MRVVDRAKRLEMTFSGGSSRTSAFQAGGRERVSQADPGLECLGASAAAALFLALFLSRGTNVSWAEMLAAAAARPWVHGTTTYSDGEHTVTSESWVSAGNRIAAFKSEDRRLFEDIEAEVILEYDAKEETISRAPSLRPGATFALVGEGRFSEAHLPGFLDGLIGDQGSSPDLFYGERVIKAERHQEAENGRQWVLYLIHLQRIDNSAPLGSCGSGSTERPGCLNHGRNARPTGRRR